MDSSRKNSKWYFLALLLAGGFFIWYAVWAESKSNLRVAFLGVGQGDATLIDFPNGRQVLIDGGPNRQVLSQITKVIPFYDRSIDIVIATHPDQDHIGGLVDILKRYDVDIFLDPGVESSNAVNEELERILGQKKTRKILAKRGMKINLGQDSYLLILFPDRDVSKMDTNDASIVAKLVYKNATFLFMGDSPKKIEDYLVSLDEASPRDELNADVLKAGHHGSRTSSGEFFVRSVSPELAIISSGKNNRYGHPHKEVIDILRKVEAKISRTDSLGTIIIESDGKSVLSP